MLPVYFVIGLLNIFSQHHNYGIKIDDPNFDVRVRRSIVEDGKKPLINLLNTEENNLKRDKRYAYYKKTRITNNDITRYNNENNNNGNETAKTNRYDIFNPNYNYLFNKTNNNLNKNLNNSGINNLLTNYRPMTINSYPYGYPPGYARTNPGLRTNQVASTTGYKNEPVFYNYQNPDGKNFAGFAGYSANKLGLVTTPMPYLPSYTQNPTNIFTSNFPTQNNLPASYTTTSRPGIHNLPYGTNPANGVYNNLAPYAPNFGNGSANFNNGFPNFNNGSANFDNGSLNFNNGSTNFDNGSANFTDGSVNFNNGSYISVNSTNTTVTTTEKILKICVICNIPCPRFMKRFGSICAEAESIEDDYS
ncbi:hypothetical protein PYW08_012884 [Mythimna loreyi]|uniref:Uncharacterized protein n=1 Tax=Mythimna loreyi TaxID=667449 RepID=A0ACC2Q213_9NEOP|nr:hypothetical protein PYW08_012884 [Mythimna loreyi]